MRVFQRQRAISSVVRRRRRGQFAFRSGAWQKILVHNAFRIRRREEVRFDLLLGGLLAPAAVIPILKLREVGQVTSCQEKKVEEVYGSAGCSENLGAV